MSAVSTSVPIDVTRVNVTGGSSFLPEYCRALVSAAHPPERLYFPPSNAHSHVSDDVHVAMPTHDSPDPQSFREAISSSDAPKWKIGMERELKAFCMLDVLEMYMLPHGTNLISCMWLFITKYNSDGSLNKYKSRLVAREFSQIHGLDINKTFAPTATMAALRIFITLANQYGYHCHGCDIETASLHAILTEECFMEIPVGYFR